MLKKILITPPFPTPEEILKVKSLLKNDFDLLHLRKPQLNYKSYKAYLKQLGTLSLKTVLCNYHQLSNEFDIYGLHFNKKQRLEGLYENFLERKNLSISSSFHTFTELQRSPFHFTYGLLSPVYNSLSKPGYHSHFTSLELKYINKKTPFPLVALGGITPDKLNQLASYGFWGAAMLGHIWN